MYPSTVVLISYGIKYMLRARSSTSELNGPSKVAAKHTGYEGVTTGARTPEIHTLNPENSPGTWLTE